MTSRLPWLAGLLGLLAALLPVGTTTGSLRLAAAAVVPLLALAAALAVGQDRWRTPVAVALVLWAAVALAPAPRTPAVGVVAVGCGLLVRAWAGLPELARLGRAAAPDLLAEALGGVLAAGLVVAVAGGVDEQPAPALAAGLLGVLLLATGAVLRLRR